MSHGTCLAFTLISHPDIHFEQHIQIKSVGVS